MSDTPRTIIAMQELWVRTSADYDTAKHIRARVFSADSTVKDVLDWAASGHAIGRGQIRLDYEGCALDAAKEE